MHSEWFHFLACPFLVPLSIRSARWLNSFILYMYVVGYLMGRGLGTAFGVATGSGVEDCAMYQ
jgi:hypothetical protein